MKAKKALLPILASALVLAMGLAACTKPAGPSGKSGDISQSADEGEEVAINVTAEGDKKELQVGETVQLHADVEGVEWTTRAEGILSVDSTGLVTALGPGSGRVTARKDGYANGSITLTVQKAPERPWKYEVRLELAEHYDPDDFWGMDASQWGMGILGPGDSPVEDNSGATDDGTSLGWLQQGCKETMTFTSDKATKVELGVTMAYNAQMDLSAALSVKFNGVAISMANKVCEGPDDGNDQNYYDFHAVSFGMVDLVAGNNVLEIEMIAQGPNMDKVVIWTEETLAIAAVPAVVKERIEVANATLTVEEEKTVQIELTKPTSAEGVNFVSDHPEIASVNASGLVTGVAVGKATITISKEGMKDATVSVTVTEKPQAGTVILEAESAVLVGAAQIETNNAAAHGGAHVGYLSADTSVTFTYTAEAAAKLRVIFVAASCANLNWQAQTVDDQVLSECMTLTFNDAPISLEGRTLIGGTFGEWHDVDLGLLDFKAGENTFVFAFTAQGPNLDYIKIVDPNYVPEVTYTVSFNANGGTGEMAPVANVSGEYTLPECGFTAPDGATFKAWKVGNQEKQPGDKIYVNADTEIQAVWQLSSVTISFNANTGSGSMDAVTAAPGEYTLPECGFTAPEGYVFDGWEYAGTNQYGQPATLVGKVGDKVNVQDNIEFKATWKVIIVKSTQLDLSSAYYIEFEDADLAGGAREETNANAHGGKSVGYFAQGASAKFTFNASAAGSAKLILIGHSDLGLGDWHQEGGIYVQTNTDHPIKDCLTISVNNAPVTIPATAGYLGEDGVAYIQIDLGNISLVAGKNEILVSASAQAPNFDAIALVSDTLTFSEYVEPLPEGMISLEFEDGEFERPEGSDETNALVVDSSNKKASGGKNVGYAVAGAKITLKFNASAAGKVGLSFIGASAKTSGQWWSPNMAEHALADCLTLKVNGTAIDLAGKVLPGTSGQNYYNWATLDLGEIDAMAGLNTIVLELTAQGPNLDCLRIQGSAGVVVSLVA